MSAAARETVVQVKKPLKGNTRLIDLQNTFWISLPNSWDTQRNINDVIDTEGHTPLTCALRYREENLLKILLGCGDIDLNQADQRGRTPLMMAFVFMKEYLQTLYLNGADLAQKSTSIQFDPKNCDMYSDDPSRSLTVVQALAYKRADKNYDNVADIICEYAWFLATPVYRMQSSNNPFVLQISMLNSQTLNEMSQTLAKPYPRVILDIIVGYLPPNRFEQFVEGKSAWAEDHWDWIHEKGKAHFEKRQALIQRQRLEQVKLGEQKKTNTLLATLSAEVATLNSTVKTQGKQIELLTQQLQAQQKLFSDLSQSVTPSSNVSVLSLSSSRAASSNTVQDIAAQTAVRLPLKSASETVVPVKKPLKGNTRLASLPVHLPESWDAQRNINEVIGKDGYTPLTAALRYNNEGTVEALLACNDIDPNQEDGRGRAPLMVAYDYSRKFVEVLLLKGADLKKEMTDTTIENWPPEPRKLLNEIKKSKKNSSLELTLTSLMDLAYGGGLICEYIWFTTMPHVKKDPKAPKPEEGNPFVEREITELNITSLMAMCRRMEKPFPNDILTLICDYIPNEKYEAYTATPSDGEGGFREWIYRMGEEHFDLRDQTSRLKRIAQTKSEAQTVTTSTVAVPALRLSSGTAVSNVMPNTAAEQSISLNRKLQ